MTLLRLPLHCITGEHILKDDDVEVGEEAGTLPEADTQLVVHPCTCQQQQQQQQQMPCCACYYQCNAMCSNASVANHAIKSIRGSNVSLRATDQYAKNSQPVSTNRHNQFRDADSMCASQIQCCTSQVCGSPTMEPNHQEHIEEDLLESIQRQLKEGVSI